MITSICTNVKRCRNPRTCDYCAAARQAKYANAAEVLEQQHGQLTLTVLIPDNNSQAEIRRLHASFLRRACAPAGIWTVETGTQFAGLHLNILSPKPAPARWRNARNHTELVRTTAREAAAYITKRTGIPPIEQYIGKTAGTFGQLYSYFSDDRAYPVVQAAAIEAILNGGKIIMPPTITKNHEQDWSRHDDTKPMFYNADQPHLCNPPLKETIRSREEYLESARRHLPNLYAAVRRQSAYQPPKQLAPEKNGAWPEGRE